jgi:hypothetical protein
MNDQQRLRLHQFLRSPGGCALLLEMQAHNLTPAEALEPYTAIHLVAVALWHLSPWFNQDHARYLKTIREQSHPLHHLAADLIAQPGIERWWAPLQRDRQTWIQCGPDQTEPTQKDFPTPVAPPDSRSIYVQRPHDWFATSTEVSGSTSQLANIMSGETDWYIRSYTAQRRLLTVNPDARILEIDSAEDWHRFVVAYPAQSHPDQAFNISDHCVGYPWGPNDGLVPDWGLAAHDWDGVHVTLWAFLTATQVRITSDAGWTEPWAWEGEETTWLHWAFESVTACTSIPGTAEGFDFETLGLPEPRTPHFRWNPERGDSGQALQQ